MRFDKEVYQLYRKIESLLTEPGRTERTLKPTYHELSEVLEEVQNAIKAFSEPLRVAVAGYMKAGKSTLLNAIMQRKMLFTGSSICTYTPTWFKYAPEESIDLVFRDGNVHSNLPLSELEQWTSIEMRDKNQQIDDLAYVILYCPNEILKRIELIDTPGLFSPEEDDSMRTIQLLGLAGLDEANQLNEQQVSLADAVLYAFTSNFKETDLSAVSSFTSTPINAIGVFTKLDQVSNWNSLDQTDITPAQQMAPTIARYSDELKNRLYCVLPVVGIIVEGFSELSPELWTALLSIAQEDSSAVNRALRNANRFAAIELGETTPEQRQRLMRMLGAYGIASILQGIRDGICQEDMGDYLYSLSGVADVVNKLESHFGNRAFIIKTEAALGRIEAKLNKLEHSDKITRQSRQMCCQIEREISEVRNLPAFAELHLLQEFYEGTLQFPTADLNQSFLYLMGENGNSAAAKLGLSEKATIAELQQRVIELHEQWGTQRSNFTLSRKAKNALEVILSSITELRYHLDMLTTY